MGFRGRVARTNLADANEAHDWRIFADFAQVLIGIARPLYARDFKWIKQHLRLKAFYGTRENAVKTQIWIAVSVYVLVAIVDRHPPGPVPAETRPLSHAPFLNQVCGFYQGYCGRKKSWSSRRLHHQSGTSAR